jgi:hypothetical protein
MAEIKQFRFEANKDPVKAIKPEDASTVTFVDFKKGEKIPPQEGLKNIDKITNPKRTDKLLDKVLKRFGKLRIEKSESPTSAWQEEMIITDTIKLLGTLASSSTSEVKNAQNVSEMSTEELRGWLLKPEISIKSNPAFYKVVAREYLRRMDNK